MSSRSGKSLHLNNKMSALRYCVLFWASTSLAQILSAQTFAVTNMHGGVGLGSSQGNYRPAQVHSKYSLPSWGKTDEAGYLTIAFDADNSFHLLPDSEAEIRGENDSDKQWHRVVKLHIGDASFDHNSSGEHHLKLDCETPTSICGAIGTHFEVNATKGVYSVNQGTISISSPSETALSLTISGSTVTYNPGRENTYSNGTVNGYVTIAGVRFRAVGAEFTVSKKLGANDDTAVRIISGTLSGTGGGDYTIQSRALAPIKPTSATAFANYLTAAEDEGRIKAGNAAYEAARITPPARFDSAALAAATKIATDRRNKLFNRGLPREINAEQLQSIQQQTH